MTNNAAAKQAPLPIVTPCHGAPLIITVVDEGGRTLPKADDISCSAPGCHNFWDAQGVADRNNY